MEVSLPPGHSPLPHHHPLRGRTSDLLQKLEPTGSDGFTYSSSMQRHPPNDATVETPDAERPGVLKLSGYRDQLRELGASLFADKYRSLTQLDLSRNSLTSLNGLQNLGALRHLSLYYNMVRRGRRSHVGSLAHAPRSGQTRAFRHGR